MSRWWVSWYQPVGQPFELIHPWWRIDGRDTAGREAYCAALICMDEAAARAAIEDVQGGSVPVLWRFVTRKENDWEPFSERFPRAEWMVWPVQKSSLARLRIAGEEPAAEDTASSAPPVPCKVEECDNLGAVTSTSGGRICWDCLARASAALPPGVSLITVSEGELRREAARMRGCEVIENPVAVERLKQELADIRASRDELAQDMEKAVSTATRLGAKAERHQALRIQAEWTAERRTRERDEALAALARQAVDVERGRALAELVGQIERLRRTAPEQTPFGFDPDDVAKMVAREAAEVQDETPCSTAAREECGDVLAGAVHLLLAHRGNLVQAIAGVAAKLRARLDLVDQGLSWESAKAKLAEAKR